MTDPALIRLIARFIQTKQPGNSIIEQMPQAFRGCFQQLVELASETLQYDGGDATAVLLDLREYVIAIAANITSEAKTK